MTRDETFLRQEIKRLQRALNEFRVRLPPHDPPMSMMIELDDLEVEQDELRAELKALLKESES